MNHHRIVEVARAAIAADEVCVLCTVVRLDGSGYGRPGARLLLTESGQREGYISGGCLEKDLCRRVWAATLRGPKLIAFDTRGNAVGPPRFNTGCEGIVYVLCQRISRHNQDIIGILESVDSCDEESRLLTIYRSESNEFNVGNHWIDRDSDPAPVELPKSVAEGLKRAKRNASIRFDDVQGNPVEAAIEILRPRRRVVIFGAGDDVIPVVASAVIHNWHVTVVGQRPELACASRFPNANVLCGAMHSIAGRLKNLSRSDVVVMTHDFDRDVQLLPVLLDGGVRSVGLLGPKRRLGRLVQSLYAHGRRLTDAEIHKIRSPVGLDIGAITPEEIAVSIIAELIAMPKGRRGGTLHDRRTPLHEPTPHLVASTPESLISKSLTSKPSQRCTTAS